MNQADETKLVPPLTDLYYALGCKSPPSGLYYALKSQVSDLRSPLFNSPNSRYYYDESYALSILTRWTF